MLETDITNKNKFSIEELPLKLDFGFTSVLQKCNQMPGILSDVDENGKFTNISELLIRVYNFFKNDQRFLKRFLRIKILKTLYRTKIL